MKGGSSHHCKAIRRLRIRRVTINNLGPRPRGDSDRKGNKFAYVRLQSLACLPVLWLEHKPQISTIGSLRIVETKLTRWPNTNYLSQINVGAKALWSHSFEKLEECHECQRYNDDGCHFGRS